MSTTPLGSPVLPDVYWMKAVAEPSDEGVGVGDLERPPPDVVGHVVQHRHVVAHAALQEAAVLEHRRNLPPPISVGDVGMGATVDENITAVGIVEAAHEVGDGRLA